MDVLKRHPLPASLVVLLAVFLLVRLPIWERPPQTYADSATYLEPTDELLTEDFEIENYDSERGLAYPFFLSTIFRFAGDDNLPAVVGVQKVLGLLITLLLFFIGVRLSGSYGIGLLFGLFYALNVPAALFEVTILAETLSTFLTVVLLLVELFALRMVYRRESALRLLPLFALTGVLCGILALSKHKFLLFWVAPTGIFALLILYQYALRRLVSAPAMKRRLLGLLAIAVVPAGIAIGWSVVNWNNFGWFTFSPISGINLSNVAGGFIEYASDPRCNDFVNVYLQYRQAEIERTGTHAMTIYRTLQAQIDPENFQQRVEYQRLAYDCSLSAILARPDLYLKTALASSDLFWDPAIYSRVPLQGPPKWLADQAKTALLVLRRLFEFATVLWLALLLAIFRARFPDREAVVLRWWEIGLLLASIWYVYLVSSGFEFGENRRYKSEIEAFIPVVIFLTFQLYAALLSRVLGRRKRAPQRN